MPLRSFSAKKVTTRRTALARSSASSSTGSKTRYPAQSSEATSARATPSASTSARNAGISNSRNPLGKRRRSWSRRYRADNARKTCLLNDVARLVNCGAGFPARTTIPPSSSVIWSADLKRERVLTEFGGIDWSLDEVDVEQFADIVSGKVFDGRLDEDGIAPPAPRRVGGESPCAFEVLKRDVSRDHLPGVVGDPDHAFGQRVLQRFGESNDHGLARVLTGRADDPVSGVGGNAIGRADAESLDRFLFQRPILRIVPRGIDAQQIFLTGLKCRPHVNQRLNPAFD